MTLPPPRLNALVQQSMGGPVDRPGPAIFYPLDCFGLCETTHRRMQGEADVDHLILKSTYLLLHLVRLVHQRPISMHLSSKPSVFFVDKGRVDPLHPWVFAEEDECVSMGVGLGLIGAESRRHMSGLLVHQMSFPHRPPHHQVVVHSRFDKARGVEATLMTHLHGTKVGGHIVIEPGRASRTRQCTSRLFVLLDPLCPPEALLRPPRPRSHPAIVSSFLGAMVPSASTRVS